MSARRNRRAELFLVATILLIGFWLRVWQLASIPPGLTHDEAGHGHDAAHVLKGITPIYFTVGYGREPLFDYLNAGWIALAGASPFTFRLAAVFWGIITLAATRRVARLAFDSRTALIALALMAVSFWPLVTSRQILRSAMLPAQMALAVVFFLELFRAADSKKKWLFALGLGLTVAASLYTYIPARVLWLIFPLAALASRYALRNTQYSIPNTQFTFYVLLSCLIALTLATPLLLYLYQHPEAETRIGDLSSPLVALRNGDATPIFTNIREMALAFFLPGHGDHFLAYTLPGKSIFDPILFIFFILGLFILFPSLFSLPSSLLLLWLLLGLAPSFITGPEALTTRSIGAQPLLYILPALALSRLLPARRRLGFWLLGFGIFTLCAFTVRDYFFVWAGSPDVRAAYQVNTVAMAKAITGPAVISSVYPSAPHDPYIAELITSEETRWADGRYALLIPEGPDFQLLVPSSTPLHPSFASLVQRVGARQLKPNDLDPSFDIYRFGPHRFASLSEQFNFNGGLALIEFFWSAASYTPGDVAELLTVWQVRDPARLGPTRAPTFKTDLNLFTHILNADGSIFLQRDALDAPSWDWQAGDTIIQLHQFAVPPEATVGEYPTEVGLYDRITGERLPVLNSDATSTWVAPLNIIISR